MKRHFKTYVFDKTLELVEKVKENENLRFDYCLTKGRAQMGKGEYEDAIAD